jgi:pimeloyl-ACP methyl ester carboxylesterase
MMAAKPENSAPRDIFFTARDGLRLHAYHYPAYGVARSLARPVLCLPGLTRNGRDFHDLALALSCDLRNPRDVYTFDYRGRGLSEFDPDWRNYAVPIEMLDVLDLITVAGLESVAIVGTSRGGLISMLMAAARPAVMGALVLNDIGPVVERSGLARISAYVGRVPVPNSWADAAKLLRDLNKRAFPKVTDQEWEEVARQWYNEVKGRPAPGYDQKLCNALSVLDGPMPSLWPQFEALRRIPLLVLRGENSDLLSVATVEEMRRRHANFSALTVPNQGHAPLLKDKPTIDAIRDFFDAADYGHLLPVQAIA